MQTFLPYPDFSQSALTLDRARLGKQRVECMQIARALLQGPKVRYDLRHKEYLWLKPVDDWVSYTTVKTTPWYFHPAVQMWKGHGYMLCVYWQAILDAWIGRGYVDSTRTCLNEYGAMFLKKAETSDPPWLGIERLHESHRSKLIEKFPEHYRHLFPGTPEGLPYFWPVRNVV